MSSLVLERLRCGQIVVLEWRCSSLVGQLGSLLVFGAAVAVMELWQKTKLLSTRGLIVGVGRRLGCSLVWGR